MAQLLKEGRNPSHYMTNMMFAVLKCVFRTNLTPGMKTSLHHCEGLQALRLHETEVEASYGVPQVVLVRLAGEAVLQGWTLPLTPGVGRA